MIVTLQTFKRKKMGSNGFIFEYLITITGVLGFWGFGVWDELEGDTRLQDARRKIKKWRVIGYSDENGEEFVDDSGGDKAFAETLDHGADFLGFLDERHSRIVGENACGKTDVELGAEFTDRTFSDG